VLLGRMRRSSLLTAEMTSKNKDADTTTLWTSGSFWKHYLDENCSDETVSYFKPSRHHTTPHDLITCWLLMVAERNRPIALLKNKADVVFET